MHRGGIGGKTEGLAGQQFKTEIIIGLAAAMKDGDAEARQQQPG
ncbi:MAG TPA: hypothetical protein PKJ19_06775 [Flavobacteriales bacterium]|nr:hypothetical protein [Flavobacteriales bacterium]HNU55040.1 hypothetical protein [Flavobacteriales bacterium]